eukprot:7386352-Prymnesium_polylepis.3
MADARTAASMTTPTVRLTSWSLLHRPAAAGSTSRRGGPCWAWRGRLQERRGRRDRWHPRDRGTAAPCCGAWPWPHLR